MSRFRDRPARKPTDEEIDRFSEKAPDGQRAAPEPEPDKGVKMGNKRQISLTIAPELLRRTDALAKRRGMSRASIMIAGLAEYLERHE